MIRESTRLISNLQISDSDPSDNSMRASPSPFPIDGFSVNINVNAGGCDSSTALHHFLSNDFTPTELDSFCEDFDVPFDVFSGDHFRMFEFKVRKCARSRSHDWTECPYAHSGEKALRRDPRKYHYSGTACPEFRKGNCMKGDSCEFAHGVFECWLHPSRYRTQLCKDGTNCRRRVCFFAHNSEQLRLLGKSSDGSRIFHAFDSSWSNASVVSSPTSVLNLSPISSLSDSPPSSPGNPQYGGRSFNAMSEIATSMRNVQLDNLPSTGGPQVGPVYGSPRGFQVGSAFGSPRGSNLRSEFFSLPSTPTRVKTKSGFSPLDLWDQAYQEEPAMERVESGRELRAKIYAKLSKENSFGRSNTAFSSS